MTQSKHRFSAAERFGIWMAYDGLCFWCREPFQFAYCSIDHVIPESTPPNEISRLRELYALGDVFEVNGFCNWVPSHPLCNSRKATGLERVPSPAMIAIFRDIFRCAENARTIAERIRSETRRSKVLARLEAAVEQDLLSREDVEALFGGLPATLGTSLLVNRRWRAIRDDGEYRYIADEYLPKYRTPEAQLLGEHLAAARDRLARLTAVGVDATEVRNEILELRRSVREGGQLREGDVLGERYVLLRRIGHGGFATVWEAADDIKRTRVAVKVLRSELATDEIRRERFARGARTMRELAHPSIVPLLSNVANDGGYHYFVMEFAERGDLRQAVLAGELTREEAINTIITASEALAHAHARGRIHRDVKPANILITSTGRAYLTDFDLVGAADTTGGTRTSALGTFIYAAPELLDRPQDATARADVYGIGMSTVFVIYGKDLTMDTKREPDETIDAFDCNEAVKAVLRQAVAWDAAERFANAKEFLEALRLALANTEATRTPRPQKTRSKKKTIKHLTSRRPRRYAVPDVTKRKLLNAMSRFDTEFRGTRKWSRWPGTGRHRYAVEHEGLKYPVKQLLSLASGMPTYAFSGGDDANNRIREHGFRIVELQPRDTREATEIPNLSELGKGANPPTDSGSR